MGSRHPPVRGGADRQRLTDDVSLVLGDGRGQVTIVKIQEQLDAGIALQVQRLAKILDQSHQVASVALGDQFRRQFGGQHHHALASLGGRPTTLGLQADLDILVIQFDPLALQFDHQLALFLQAVAIVRRRRWSDCLTCGINL